jgi:hypothetical protein
MEEWRDCVGFEGFYQVSNLGRIRSLDRVMSNGRKRKGQMMKTRVGTNGYVKVGLRDGVQQRTVNVHREVALAFIDGYAEGKVVDHIDGDKANNKVDNLRWVSQSVNNTNRKECNSFSGETGIEYRSDMAKSKPWLARVKIKGKTHNLGYHAKKQEAVDARNKFIEELF